MEFSNQGGADSTSSTKPYLIRAIYDWAMDNGFTPQILVATDNEQVVVPSRYAKDNRIVLNIHPQSVQQLEMGNEFLMFSARFSGKPHEITVPIISVLAIYARENGQGIVFQEEEQPSPDTPTDHTRVKQPKSNDQTKSQDGSHLKLVK